MVIATLDATMLFMASCKPQKADSFRLMTYKIRFDNPDDGLNAWPYRKVHIAQMVKFYGVDLLGMQEEPQHQFRNIMNMLGY